MVTDVMEQCSKQFFPKLVTLYVTFLYVTFSGMTTPFREPLNFASSAVFASVSKLYLKPSVLYSMTSAFAAILITVNRAMSMHLMVNDFFIFRCFFANSSLLTVNRKDCMHTNTKNVEPVLSLVPRS